MPKAREFWINLKVSPKSAYPEPNFGGRKGLIHVREVVPIDWEKVWKKFMSTANFNEGFGMAEVKQIQELVEKALKGEL